MSESLQILVASPWQALLACFIAFCASVLGGLSGFGTGLVLPVFLVPLVGVANVIPVMAVAMLFNNAGRVLAFRREADWTHVRRILVLGMPACAAGAYGYTLLDARWIAALLGSFLLLSVPLRRVLHSARFRFRPSAEVGMGACFGFVNGGMTGAGVILISTLMSSGLVGAQLIATDAVISVAMGLLKIALFGTMAALTVQLAVIGLLVGACTTPGAFVARWLLRRIPAGVHAWIMECVVVVGALSLLWKAL
jgi:uncharacterized membrane protein YfcA